MKDNIIFVGGAPRSGTTLVQRLLDSHPDIVGGPELNAISDIITLFNQMRERIEEERTDFYGDTEQLRSIFRTFILSIFKQVRDKYKAKWISEKTPSNVLVFNELHQIFPDAKFLYVERDPKDILSSYRKIKQNAMKRKQVPPYVNRSLFLSVDDIFEHMITGKTFYDKNKDVSYLLIYEKLVEDPAGEMEKFFNFLGLPYSQNVLLMNGPGQFYIQKRVEKVNSIYYNQADIAKPIDNSSVGKWKKSINSREASFVDHIFKEINCFDYQSTYRGDYILRTFYTLHRKLMNSHNLLAVFYRKILYVFSKFWILVTFCGEFFSDLSQYYLIA